MAGINKVILVGHIGRDPELRQAGTQQRAQFSLATSRSWRDKQGNRQENTQWHRVVTWGNTAVTIAQYAKKGRQVYVEGSLETREFEHNGERQRVTEVNARIVELLGPRDDAGPSRGRQADPSGVADYGYAPPSSAEMSDDVPF